MLTGFAWMFVFAATVAIVVSPVASEKPHDACEKLLTELNEEFDGYWELSATGCRLVCGTWDTTTGGHDIQTRTIFVINEGEPCVEPVSGLSGACNLSECHENATADPARLGSLPGPHFMEVDIALADLVCGDMAAENASLLVGVLEVDLDGYEVFNLVCDIPPPDGLDQASQRHHEANHHLARCHYKKANLHRDSILSFIMIDEDNGRIYEREDYDVEQLSAQDITTEIYLSPTCRVDVGVACTYLYHHQKEVVRL